MPARSALALAALLAPLALAGCLTTSEPLAPTALPAGPAVPLAYEVRAPDEALALLEHAELIPLPEGIALHVRIVRPDVEGPVPVVAQFTPYTAPGRAMAVEPLVREPSGTFVQQLVRRGFAFAYADVRGTGDSGGCLDLRGSLDIQDAWQLTEFLGTQPWSNGKVGFIGASYPGSEAHIAAIAGNPHLGGVVPVVASTSFYDYHHKGGVPYRNHLATNVGYNQNAAMPTLNPQLPNWVERQVDEALHCDQGQQMRRGLDQSGAYDAWWHDRNLRPRVGQVQVPVLMAQGLADWNVKPDHIATWFNDLRAPKTLIAGQWGHQYPADADEAYGAWWELATLFFDWTLRGDAAAGALFAQDRAYVQDTEEAWHVYEGAWPPRDVAWTPLNLTAEGLRFDAPPAGMVGWDANPGSGEVAAPGPEEQVVLELELDRDLHLSGTPHLNLTITSTADDVHLVAVLERWGEVPASDPLGGALGAGGEGWVRENYGYLNPTYRHGLQAPERLVPGVPTPVTIAFYPQEDVLRAGTLLRLVLRSVDGGRTVPVFDEARIEVALDGERPAQLWLPVRAADDGALTGA